MTHHTQRAAAGSTMIGSRGEVSGPEGPAVVVTVGARSTVSVPFGLLCNGEPAGKQSLDVMASAAAPGVSVTAGQMQAWALSR